MFTKTIKQREACDKLNHNDHTLLVGGSRSTKTTVIIRNIILRALKKPSRHLIVRLRFNHAMQSLWHDTIPKVFENFFPKVLYKLNSAKYFIEVPSGRKKSQIWLGGTDSKERIEKVLGNEYSTIFANECSQIDYDAITTMRTRLAEASGLNLRFYYDMNPIGKKHWTYEEFVKQVMPGTSKKHKLNVAHMFLNPKDNPYLPRAYLNALDALPTRKRNRFFLGKFLDDVDGALWTDTDIMNAQAKSYGEIIKTVIAVDPAVSNNPNSDACGIVACGLDENREGVVLGDYTIKASTRTWAQRAVNAYHDHEANYIVAEVNQGGDLVEDALKNIDRSIKVVKVRASKGKFARAEPISELYELGKIAHKEQFAELEEEMTNWVPMNTKESPNRIDALVWGMYFLMIKPAARIHVG